MHKNMHLDVAAVERTPALKDYLPQRTPPNARACNVHTLLGALKGVSDVLLFGPCIV
jgi:hypothetical protein